MFSHKTGTVSWPSITVTSLHSMHFTLSHWTCDDELSQPAVLQVAARDRLKITIIRHVLCHRPRLGQETTEWPHHSRTETRKQRMVYEPVSMGWLSSRVVSVVDSGTEGPGFKSQPRRCRVTVLGKLFTPIVPLFTKQQNLVAALIRVARVTAGLKDSNGSLPPGYFYLTVCRRYPLAQLAHVQCTCNSEINVSTINYSINRTDITELMLTN